MASYSFHNSGVRCKNHIILILTKCVVSLFCQNTNYFKWYVVETYHLSYRFLSIWKNIVYQICVERSKGSKLWDIDGNEYIDLVNGFGQTAFGHSPDFVIEAVTRQSGFDPDQPANLLKVTETV